MSVSVYLRALCWNCIYACHGQKPSNEGPNFTNWSVMSSLTENADVLSEGSKIKN